MMKIVLNTHREAYNTKEIKSTLTVRELIEYLEQFDDDTPVYFGNDKQSYGWYTYGSIYGSDIYDVDDDEDDEFDD